jgi:hypothetical protein
MKSKKAIGLLAALLVLTFLSVALVVHSQHGLSTALGLFSVLGFAMGTATINYKYPVSASIAPTAQQVYGLGVVTAQVNFGDTDISAVVTHNFGLSANELADLFPIVIIDPTSGGTVFPQFTFTKATNAVTMNKASTSGTGGTFDVTILRPHTNQGGTIGINR